MCVRTTIHYQDRSLQLAGFRVHWALPLVSLQTCQVHSFPLSISLNSNLTQKLILILNFPSDLNGISVNISVMDPLIKWTQTPNPLYPTCITKYVVTDQGNQSLTITVDSTVTSLTAQQLNAAGFPYCISIHPTVTPMTPMGPLTPQLWAVPTSILI